MPFFLGALDLWTLWLHHPWSAPFMSCFLVRTPYWGGGGASDLSWSAKLQAVTLGLQVSFGAYLVYILGLELLGFALKTLLFMGGGNANNNTFPTMAGDSSLSKVFIDSSIALARNYSFHNLNLDWEYPQTMTDMNNLGKLFSEWRICHTSWGSSHGRWPPVAPHNGPLFLSQILPLGDVREYPIAVENID